MKPLIFALLVFSISAFADFKLDETIAELAKARDQAIEALKQSRPNKGKLPDPEYVSAYNKYWDSFADEEIKARKQGCGRTPNCVTAEQEAQIKAQTRIVTGLMTAKNNWATEGKSESEIQTREEAFNNCAKQKKDCDKLPETDRKVAEEGQGSTTTTTVVVTPNDDRKPADETTKKLEDAKKAAEEAMNKEIADLEKAFDENHPAWKDKEVTLEVKDFHIAQINKTLELTLAMYKKLCEEFPGTDACLSEEQVDALKDEAARGTCFLERNFITKSVVVDAHKTEWDALPKPRACKTLLDKDKGSSTEPKKDEPVVVEEGDDEKSPRNYKAETCKWVSDLPRKIVNGPGCGSKSRSRICTGYVVCEQKQGGGKFIRMSTCGADKCGPSDDDAVRCTKDMHYYSQKPAGESKLFMTPKLKKILSGSSEQ